MKKIVIAMIVFYQRVFSLDKGFMRHIFPLVRGTCVMYPSCSEYMILTIEKNGVVVGVFRGIFRIFRCHPYQKKRIDLP